MKKTNLTIMVLALVLMVRPAEVCEASPMGTAWTYQGRLMDYNSPGDGEYDFQFKLFDDPCTGSQVAGPVQEPNLDVIDGYFTVELDFGSTVFDGKSIWLEIEVRQGDSNDANDFVTLNPRQEVTPVPYSLYAAGSDWNNLNNIPPCFADGIDNVGSGDITAVYAGTGLDGGGSAGDVTVSVSTSWADGRYVNEAQANSVTSNMITDRTIDDADMGFMRWGRWYGRNEDVIFEAADRVRIYLESGSDLIFIRNLHSSNPIIVGYAVHKNATTSIIGREAVSAGATISFDVAWCADISININGLSPSYLLFFKGLYSASSEGAIIVGYYNYFDSSPVATDSGSAEAEGLPIKLSP